jgi:hypothetical protein
MIDQFSNEELLFPTVALIEHFAKSIPSITTLLRELFLPLLMKVIVHDRCEIRQSALATVSFFCIADVEAFTVEDLQMIAWCHRDNIRDGEWQDKALAMDFYRHLAHWCPEKISCIIDKDVQLEIMEHLVHQWGALDAIVESAFEEGSD